MWNFNWHWCLDWFGKVAVIFWTLNAIGWIISIRCLLDFLMHLYNITKYEHFNMQLDVYCCILFRSILVLAVKTPTAVWCRIEHAWSTISLARNLSHIQRSYADIVPTESGVLEKILMSQTCWRVSDLGHWHYLLTLEGSNQVSNIRISFKLIKNGSVRK